jgi:anti-anti-sigma regulatory factor
MRNTVTFREEGDVVVVDVCGKPTIERDSGALGAMLQELAEAGYRNVLLNLAELTHIDNVGLEELLAGYANLARPNCGSGAGKHVHGGFVPGTAP